MSHWCLLLMSHWCLLAVTHWPQYIESDDSLLYRRGIINNSQYHCSSSTCFPTQANIISFVSAVARKFVQGRHPGWYLRSKPLPILVSAKQPLHVLRVSYRVSYCCCQ